MFKTNYNISEEIAEAMQQNMVKTASVDSEERALELLVQAANLLDKAGCEQDADIITGIIAKRAWGPLASVSWKVLWPILKGIATAVSIETIIRFVRKIPDILRNSDEDKISVAEETPPEPSEDVKQSILSALADLVEAVDEALKTGSIQDGIRKIEVVLEKIRALYISVKETGATETEFENVPADISVIDL